MWISRHTYQDLQDRITSSHAQVVAEVGANKALKETMNWLMFRVTALEKERVVLIERMFDVKLPSPEVSARVVDDPFRDGGFNDTSLNFDGLSDAEAKAQGIEHDADGHLIYTK